MIPHHQCGMRNKLRKNRTNKNSLPRPQIQYNHKSKILITNGGVIRIVYLSVSHSGK